MRTVRKPNLTTARGARVLATIMAAIAFAGAGGVAWADATPTSTAIDFGASGYDASVPAAPAGQNGWKQIAPGHWGLSDGGLRVTASDDTNPWQLSSPVIAAAGESGTGAAYDSFATSFTVASATPGAAQPGLNIEVDVDGRTDGSAGTRAGGSIGLRDPGDGRLEISYRYPTPGSPADLSDWHDPSVTVDGSQPHTISLTEQFVTGGDDVVTVSVDGRPRLHGSTWEGYHDAAGSGKQTVDALLFGNSHSVPSASGSYDTAYPSDEEIAALADGGYVFSGIVYHAFNTPVTTPSPTPTSTPTPTSPGPTVSPSPSAPAGAPSPTATSAQAPAADSAQLDQLFAARGVDVAVDTAAFQAPAGASLDAVDPSAPFSGSLPWHSGADSTVEVFAYSTPIDLGVAPVVDGLVQLSDLNLSALAAGGHHLVFVGTQSGAIQAVAFTVADPAVGAALASTGTAVPPAFILSALGLVLAGVALLVWRRGGECVMR
ncbi:MAG TPA: hypothetical protein VGC45_14565 [Gryllotalpicola sp.]